MGVKAVVILMTMMCQEKNGQQVAIVCVVSCVIKLWRFSVHPSSGTNQQESYR